MRSCIYCGRELEKGEVCSCPGSVARRAAKAKQEEPAEKKHRPEGSASDTGTETAHTEREEKTESSYRTGYTEKESRIKRAWEKFRAKRRASEKKSGAAGRFLKFLADSIKSPVKAIEGAHDISMAAILLLAALQGASMRVCAYFAVTNVPRGPFAILASVLSFNGAEGYSAIFHLMLSLLSGAIGGIVLFLLYSGIFFLINRFIFRQSTRYRDFSQRLALAGIPLIIVGIIGIALSRISQLTLIILMLCGGAGWITLTYEALKTEWYSHTPDRVMYSMLLGLLVFFAIVCRLMII